MDPLVKKSEFDSFPARTFHNFTPFKTQFVTLRFENEEKCIQFEIQPKRKFNFNVEIHFEQLVKKSTQMS